MAGSDPSVSMEDFDLGVESFEMKKAGKFERLYRVGFGGSIDQALLLHDDVIYFGCLDHNVYAIRAEDGKLVWKFKTDDRICESSPVHSDGRLYIGSYDHHVYCLDIDSGKLIWRFRTQGEIVSTVHVEDGVVYFGSKDHNFYAVRADSGKLIWRFRTQGEIISTPAIHEGSLLMGSFDHNLYCLDAKTGKLRWKYATQQEVYNANKMLVHDGVVYFGSFDNNLRALRISDQTLLWKFPLGMYGTAASPRLHDGVLYQEARDGTLYALTLEGKEIWRFTTTETIAIPLIEEERIYVGSADFNFYCLDRKDGRVVWKFPAQGPNWWEPVIWKDTVVFSSWDCHIYALDRDTGREVWRFMTSAGPSYLPPVSEGYELQIKKVVDDSGIRATEKSRYEVKETEEVASSSEYVSVFTYRSNETAYRNKGGVYR